MLSHRAAKRIVITGGPGAGKTALLETARRSLCSHAVVLPSAARVLSSGGFPRPSSATAARAFERAVFHVEAELEWVALADEVRSLILCDRGTLDVLAYWPGRPADFFAQVDTTESEEMARYAAVLHLRVPDSASREAKEIDTRLVEVWRDHPRRIFIIPDDDPLVRVADALEVIERAGACPTCMA